MSRLLQNQSLSLRWISPPSVVVSDALPSIEVENKGKPMKLPGKLLYTTCIVMVPSCVRSLHRLAGSSRNNIFSSRGPCRKVSFAISLNQRAHSQQYVSCWRLQSTSVSDDLSAHKKRVVFLGTPEVAATSLQTLYDESLKEDCPFQIVSVVTQPPKRRRRKGKLEPSPVGKVAEDLGLTVLCPEKANDLEFLDNLATEVQPDLCITAAYGQYLPKRFLATPKYGTVNIHPSLLPRWRGASPVQRSLEAGDNPVGVSVLFTVSKMDAGPIIRQVEETISDETDTATNVLPMLFVRGTELLIDVIPDVLNGKITMEQGAFKQDEDKVVNAAMIDPSEAECKPWEETARTIHNRWRGFSMWPGAFLYLQVGYDGNAPVFKYKLLETRVLDETAEPTTDVTPGPTKKSGLRLVCYDGSVLEIKRLQAATRKPIDALSFVNGLQGKTARWVKDPPQEEIRNS